jgi:glycerol-1-phosphate dehydrogenase [NAD(P)+]
LKGRRLSVADALKAARETRALEIGAGALARVPAVFHELFGDRPAVIVADPRTMAAAGDAVLEAFRSAGHAMHETFVFADPDLYAEHRFVERLEASLRQHSAIPVAVGSGTINDLTKLAAHRTARPYLCVATAASMDGYTAFGASITHEGSKQTFDCPAPAGVVADLEVIAGAPVEMNAWGYADLLAKVTAGADWILADGLGVEPVDPLAWDIVQGALRDSVGDPAGVRARDPKALGGLIEGLMLGGFAMQATKSSRPASGAEHQFSHLWDMQHHTHRGAAPSHGLKVGIGTLAVTAFYEALLRRPLHEVDVEECCAAWPDAEAWVTRAHREFAEEELRVVAARELRAKAVSKDGLRRQLEKLRVVWPGLRERLREQLIPFGTQRAMLRAAGAATEPEEIGISRERLRDSFLQAFFIRRRFTALDLAVRTDLLDELLNELFGPAGPWPIQRSNPLD